MLSDRPKVVSGQGTNSGVPMTQEAEDSTRPEMVQQSKHDRRTIPTEKLFNRWDWFIFSVLTALSSFAIRDCCVPFLLVLTPGRLAKTSDHTLDPHSCLCPIVSE